jgi:hypothetical protein
MEIFRLTILISFLFFCKISFAKESIGTYYSKAYIDSAKVSVKPIYPFAKIIPLKSIRLKEVNGKLEISLLLPRIEGFVVYNYLLTGKGKFKIEIEDPLFLDLESNGDNSKPVFIISKIKGKLHCKFIYGEKVWEENFYDSDNGIKFSYPQMDMVNLYLMKKFWLTTGTKKKMIEVGKGLKILNTNLGKFVINDLLESQSKDFVYSYKVELTGIKGTFLMEISSAGFTLYTFQNAAIKDKSEYIFSVL